MISSKLLKSVSAPEMFNIIVYVKWYSSLRIFLVFIQTLANAALKKIQAWALSFKRIIKQI